MSTLELKIPPAVVVLLTGAAMCRLTRRRRQGRSEQGYNAQPK